MRTTVNLDDELVARAQASTGVKEKTRLLHLGLQALIEREAARRGEESDEVSRPRRRRRVVLPVSKARGGFVKGISSVKAALAKIDLEADLRKVMI